MLLFVIKHNKQYLHIILLELVFATYQHNRMTESAKVIATAGYDEQNRP